MRYKETLKDNRSISISTNYRSLYKDPALDTTVVEIHSFIFIRDTGASYVEVIRTAVL